MGRARTEPRSLLLLPPGERLRAQRLGRGSAGMWVSEDLFRLQRGRAPYGHITGPHEEDLRVSGGLGVRAAPGTGNAISSSSRASGTGGQPVAPLRAGPFR